MSRRGYRQLRADKKKIRSRTFLCFRDENDFLPSAEVKPFKKSL